MRLVMAPVMCAGAAILALIFTTSAFPAPAGFANSLAVARAMERHYNAPAYKAKLAKNGGRLTSRVLCAPTLGFVECSGGVRVVGVDVRAVWRLEKRTTQRARLTWTVRGAGVTDRQVMILAPADLRLTQF